MAGVNNITSEISQELIERVGGLVTLLEALGGILILYLIFNIINVVLSRKKRNELKKINSNLIEIKKILSKKKR